MLLHQLITGIYRLHYYNTTACWSLMFMKKGKKEKRGKFVQMFLDVVAVFVDKMSIYLGVLLTIDRYPCGGFFFSPKF